MTLAMASFQNIPDPNPVSQQKELSSSDGKTQPTGNKPSLSGEEVNIEKKDDKFHNDKKQKNLVQISFFSGNPFVEIVKGFLHVSKEALDDEQSRMLLILSVPSSMSICDLVQFLASVNYMLEHIRIIRDGKPNHYLVLLKFKDHRGTDEFFRNFNGVRFNYIDPDICHLAYVSKIEMTNESEGLTLGQREVQTCPVCLEKLDDKIQNLLTILCNHLFHSSCLAQWGDTSCPVCRYSQTPELCQDNLCFSCSSQESLWMCLICGHVGCGRYVEGHAHKHYLDSHHTYAMHLENSKVWDYAADNYVHRLVQNKSDGKPVELHSDVREPDEKLESIQLEYTHLLTSQLETQRHFFEEQISLLESETQQQIQEIKDKTKVAIEERKTLEEKLSKVTKEKMAQEKKINQLNTRINKVTTDLKDERGINHCLEQNDITFKEQIEALEKEMKDIKIHSEKDLKQLHQQMEHLMLRLDNKSEEEPPTSQSPPPPIESPPPIEIPPIPSTSKPSQQNRRRKR